MSQYQLQPCLRRPLGAARDARGATPSPVQALAAMPSVRYSARAQRPISARPGLGLRAEPSRLGGHLSRLRMSFAGLGGAGLRRSLGGALRASLGPPVGGSRLGRALRASFSGAARLHAGALLRCGLDLGLGVGHGFTWTSCCSVLGMFIRKQTSLEVCQEYQPYCSLGSSIGCSMGCGLHLMRHIP